MAKISHSFLISNIHFDNCYFVEQRDRHSVCDARTHKRPHSQYFIVYDVCFAREMYCLPLYSPTDWLSDWLTEMKYHDNEIGMNKIDKISFNGMCAVCNDTVKRTERTRGKKTRNFVLFSFPFSFFRSNSAHTLWLSSIHISLNILSLCWHVCHVECHLFKTYIQTHAHCVHLEWQSAIKKWMRTRNWRLKTLNSVLLFSAAAAVGVVVVAVALSAHIWTGTSYQVAYVQMNKINWHKYRHNPIIYVLCVCVAAAAAVAAVLLMRKYTNKCLRCVSNSHQILAHK